MTEQELLEALRAAIAPTVEDDPGLTREEIARLMGHCENWVSKNVLKPLTRDGKLVVGRRRGERSDKVGCWLPVYRVA
jgi:predicted transcriptional regulator